MSSLFPADTGARFSPCRKYRYALWRIWDADKPHALFLMMNPSTADEVNDDATVKRCQERVLRWAEIGYKDLGGVRVCNVFAWRETDSTKLAGLIIQGTDIVGPENDDYIIAAARAADIVVCGWGQPGNLDQRGANVLRRLREQGIQPYALEINKDGTPKHPLYIGYDVMPVVL